MLLIYTYLIAILNIQTLFFKLLHLLYHIFLYNGSISYKEINNIKIININNKRLLLNLHLKKVDHI